MKMIKVKLLENTGSANNERGFTIVEVMVAIAILSVGILGVASMQVSAIRGNHFSDNTTERNTFNHKRNKKTELFIISSKKLIMAK